MAPVGTPSYFYRAGHPAMLEADRESIPMIHRPEEAATLTPHALAQPGGGAVGTRYLSVALENAGTANFPWWYFEGRILLIRTNRCSILGEAGESWRWHQILLKQSYVRTPKGMS
ncbi:hypothetical protein J2T08_002022 [Neorhizobium galegae]|nr:hypothetical protein [Neorhizobium galegae]